MKEVIISILIGTACFSLNAQSYTTGFDDVEGQTGWTTYRKGVNAMSSLWDFTTASALSAPNCLSHYYPVGGTEILDDWFVSPPFDFSQGGTIDSVWHHFSGFSTPSGEDTVAIYVLEGSPDPDLATSKLMLLNYNDNYQANSTWTLDSNIQVPTLSGSAYIAFRYKTIVSWLDVKFDDLKITPTSSASVAPVMVKPQVQVYPNPSKGLVNIQVNGALEPAITIYNIQGQVIGNYTNQGGLLTLDLQAGTYFIKVGSLVKKVIVNQ